MSHLLGSKLVYSGNLFRLFDGDCFVLVGNQDGFEKISELVEALSELDLALIDRVVCLKQEAIEHRAERKKKLDAATAKKFKKVMDKQIAYHKPKKEAEELTRQSKLYFNYVKPKTKKSKYF